MAAWGHGLGVGITVADDVIKSALLHKSSESRLRATLAGPAPIKSDFRVNA
ncbi:MAG: hypothetical protein E5299_00833 [Burkholderia gladioli]|nr:MAG: hypothetical protein E5299_00833 [Burkholderia gladioli]